MSSCLVDINVWLALSHIEHAHSEAAVRWFDRLEGTAYFCRPTQMGLLRLLTNPRVMGKTVRNQQEAWKVYDNLLLDARVAFLDEPPTVDALFRELTQARSHSHHAWADAYLGALARATGLSVVSFDRVFGSMPGVESTVLAA